MKFLVVICSLLLTAKAASDADLWLKFKIDHGKTYESLSEEKVRFTIFQTNLRTIQDHNAKYDKGESSYSMGVNKFADMTTEELISSLGYKKPNYDKVNISYFKDPEIVSPPDSIDWREKGAVLEVKDQGNCGACWAFSATGSLEGQNSIKYGKKISLSEQELVDCSASYNEGGCAGGDMIDAFQYVIDNGIANGEDYNFIGYQPNCYRDNFTRADISVGSYTLIRSNETALLKAVGTAGPISIAINADMLHFYAGGIFDNDHCSHVPDHAALVIGYNTEDGVPYWIVKNSWGADWGEAGFFRVRRDKNVCGINSDSSYPNLS